MVDFRDLFAGPDELLRLEPEELGGVLLEVIPSIAPDRFYPRGLSSHVYSTHGIGAWRGGEAEVTWAVCEAVGWLINQGLAMRDPTQPGEFYVLTRRGRSLKTRADVEAYRKGNALPIPLLQPALADKVHPMFLRGDYDTAVFQAFKEVEVAVRSACGYDNTAIGKKLVTRAFNPDEGPLRDVNAIRDEREAEMALFIGAIGHCKNPASHRDVDLDREQAARLIVFASHLLAIVEERSRSQS